MLWVVPLLCTIGCASVLWIGRHFQVREAELLAWCMTGILVFANASWYYNKMWALSLIDCCAGLFAISLLSTEKWVALFVQAIGARLVLHVLDAVTGHAFEVPYLHALNATYAWMLVLVAYGGDNGRGRSFTDHRAGLRRLLLRLRHPATAHWRISDGR